MTEFRRPELMLDNENNVFMACTFFKGETKRRWLIVGEEAAEVYSKMPSCLIHHNLKTEFKEYDTNTTKFHRLLSLHMQEKLKKLIDQYASDPLNGRGLKPAIEDMMENVELQHRRLTRMLDRAFVQYEQRKPEEEKPAEATAPAPLEPSEFPTEWHHLQNLTKNTD